VSAARKRKGWLSRAWQRIRNALGQRSYEAADTGRRGSGWLKPATSANAEIDRALQNTRNVCRELVRNDPIAASAVSVTVTNAVGEGIVPRAAFPEGIGDQKLPANPMDPAEPLNDRCDRIWSEALETLDVSGQLNAYGQQILACRGIIESGESLLQRHWRSLADGLTVPVQIELLEGDLLDRLQTKHLDNGGRIVQGVEFDSKGRRVQYWLHPEHPGELLSSASWTTSWQQSQPVPASEISHAYEPLRPGQVRGMSHLTPAVASLQAFADYTASELERKRMEACIFASVGGLGDNEYAINQETSGPALTVDADGVVQEEIQPGLILYPPEGASLDVHTPGSVGGVAEFRRQQLISIAAGLRLCYTLLTGDLSGTNYSSIRAGLIEFRRFIRAFRQQVLIRLVCRPQWQWSMEAAQLIGRLPMDIRTFPARWAPPQFESVDRLKDAQADNWELANATTSPSGVILGRGKIPEEVWRESSKDIKLLDELGVPAAWRVFRPWNTEENEQRGDEAEEDDSASQFEN
jgi:lambda family phage portal protein